MIEGTTTFQNDKDRRNVKTVYRAPALDDTGPAASRPPGTYEAYVVVYTGHSANRKEYFSTLGVEHREPNVSSTGFRCSLSSPLDSVRLDGRPVARHSAKALRETHEGAVEEVKGILASRDAGFDIDPESRLGYIIGGFSQEVNA